ncbi:RNA-dependent RNA polymerase [Trichostrongylus colubriformis]|uniref:RNA-dependent RNA polymerase n=1 Tax=Trichostrongylus colubriformis TaxID=6319 RepID=A0AAN8FTJ1_TRICO
MLREIKAIEDVLRISEDIDEQDEVEMDRYLIVDGWMTYKEVAEAQLSKYKGGLRAIMENYGIKTEGEIFSGCICEMRNRISDRDQDDMSFYNTNEVIEKKVTNLFREYRADFFQEFGGWQTCTKKMDKKFAVDDNIFHRLVHHPSREMQRKAIAYYRVCYETAQHTRERILSFAWLAYDVLATVRQENVLDKDDCVPATTPLYDMLRERFSVHLEEHKARFYLFMEFSNNEAARQLRRYTDHYPGLSRVLFILCEWADRNELFTARLQSHHICLILILYAIRRIAGSSINCTKPFLEVVNCL